MIRTIEIINEWGEIKRTSIDCSQFTEEDLQFFGDEMCAFWYEASTRIYDYLAHSLVFDDFTPTDIFMEFPDGSTHKHFKDIESLRKFYFSFV